MDISVNQTTKQIQDLDTQIAAETLRMAAHSQAKHDEMQQRIETARETLRVAEASLEEITAQQRSQQAKSDALKEEGMGAQAELGRVQGLIQDCQGMIERSLQSQKNSLIPYGRGIKEVLQKLKTMKWHGDLPLGPLGMHVKAKDPATWGDLLRSQLGQYLTAFAVTDVRDRNALKKVLHDSGK